MINFGASSMTRHRIAMFYSTHQQANSFAPLPIGRSDGASVIAKAKTLLASIPNNASATTNNISWDIDEPSQTEL